MTRLHSFLRYVRIESEDGDLSYTSLAFAVAVYCLLSGKQIDLTALGAFVAAVGAHRHREALAAQEDKPADNV